MRLILSVLMLLHCLPAFAIRGGSNVSERDPIASHTIYLWKMGEKGFVNCSATIIAPHWALTAAHCVVVDPYSTTPTDWLNLSAGFGDWMADSTKFIVHPDYTPGEWTNDVALVYFKASLSGGLKPMALASRAPSPGTRVQGAGYGLGNEHAKLKKVSLTITEVGDSNQIAWDQSCNGGIDHGDSGGSIYSGETLYGVISHNSGSECEGTHYAMSVAAYRGWIEQRIDAGDQDDGDNGRRRGGENHDDPEDTDGEEE